MGKVGPAPEIPELTSKIGSKQLPELVFQIGTQFGARNSPNTNMQPKTQNYAKKRTTMAAAIYKKLPETRGQLLKPTTPRRSSRKTPQSRLLNHQIRT